MPPEPAIASSSNRLVNVAALATPHRRQAAEIQIAMRFHLSMGALSFACWLQKTGVFERKVENAETRQNLDRIFVPRRFSTAVCPSRRGEAETTSARHAAWMAEE